MGAEQAELSGPDLARGVAAGEVADGEMLLGHAEGEPVLLARVGEDFFAVGASCTHYGGPLAEGILVGHQVRCPWHHAAFDVRSGEAERAPALRPLPCWSVERDGDTVRVSGRKPQAGTKEENARRSPALAARPGLPDSVVIVGAGAAGSAAAEMLRREGFQGRVTLIGAEDTDPYDRPNCSKDYLAGNAPEEWMPLWPADFWADNGIELVRGTRVAAIDPAGRTVKTLVGREYAWDALLLATGCDPVRLPLATHNLPHVLYLRTLADSRAVIAAAEHARTAVVVGGSFIGMETAAALRTRGLEVHLVAPEQHPMEKTLGPDLGRWVRSIHEQHGVRFHLATTVANVAAKEVLLKDGTKIQADLVVVGIGVRPTLALAAWAKLGVNDGVSVDEQLRTTAPGIWAAGDIARWPDAHTGRPVRVEHWVVAQRQGQTAARNILGAGEAFGMVPFFWSAHYDATVAYVGHAEKWDRAVLDGDPAALDCTVAFHEGPRVTAAATIFRDTVSLPAERLMERDEWTALARLLEPGGRLSPPLAGV
jgi:NADPH-dependent 2,4-dienoyl-CoA reductase/sulfur reductase-like enzyme/nitrite reductase/ring-hydroxylating ferredoxin subunit